jgi:N-acetylated-alpha-linked acidic dipeptidase
MYCKSLIFFIFITLAPMLGCGGDGVLPPLRGFSAVGSARELRAEKQFDAALDPQQLRAWLKSMSSAPNHVGSAHDQANANFMLEEFKSWGWDAHIETFYVLYPTPRSMTLEMIAPTSFKATLREVPIAGDTTSQQTAGALPPYNVFGADGDVTGDLVYVNYGMPDDYKELARYGVDVKGKIVIVRYGDNWRGLKPKLAYEHGAVGCIIYSDPREDGYFKGDVYPQGGWRPASGVQRGSVMDQAFYPGDPLTPGVGASRNAKRLAATAAPNILKIPVMPISYADAQPLLAALAGRVAPEAWRGALPITYHLGPGPAKVHMAIASNWTQTAIYDVVAKIRGSVFPDEWVIRGNHHDGWVFGAMDPLSGNVVLLQEAKAIGALMKAGWRPQRTLVYASWDAEEPGLMGSTEWTEAHAAELQRKAVVYVNTDTNARGFLSAGGSHSLQRLMNEVTAGVLDPETHVSVQTRLRAKFRVDGYNKAATEEIKQRAALAAAGADLPLDALGAGSDFGAFLEHWGVPALNIEYGGEDDDHGVYHSAFDTFEHYARFGDPDFSYEVLAAETVGHVVLRLADADVLPLQLSAFAETVSRYVQEVHQLLADERAHAQALASLADANAFALAADPTRIVAPPEREAVMPDVNLARLDPALERLMSSAKAYDDAFARLAAADYQLSGAQHAQLEGLLRTLEQRLTEAQGLPRRPWFRHMIYAPGLYTGYEVKTLPGVREAIEQRRWLEAEQYAGIIANVLGAYCDQVDRATTLLNRAHP